MLYNMANILKLTLKFKEYRVAIINIYCYPKSGAEGN